MNEIIKIQEHKGKQAVSAKELYDFLEVKSNFTTWIVRMFEYGFEEEKDFIPILEKSTGGRPSVDYALTLDCAKEIAMIQRTPQGKQAREYFITCEKRLREISKPLSPAEQLLQNAQLLVAQERKLAEHDDRIKQLEAKTTTTSDYYTIVGYGTLQNIKVGLQLAAKLGRKASALCKKYGYATEEMPDPRFGKVKTYPLTVLEQVFAEA